MDQSLQSVLTALGNAVINSIWQTGLVWLLVLCYTRLNKRLSSDQLNNISFAALLVGFFAFIATFVISFCSPHSGRSVFELISAGKYSQQLIIYAAILYVLLLAVPVVKLAMGTQSIHRLRREGLGKVPGTLKIFLLDAAQYLNIKRKVSIFTSALISSPLTVGFLKPVILLPVAMVNQLSTEQAQAVILHELAHIRRNDYLQNFVTQIVLTIMYFNPFVRLLATLQNLEREKSADNWVMRFEYSNSMYAGTLLLLARQHAGAAHKLAVPISGSKSPLLERVEFLLGSGKRTYPSIKKFSFMCSLMAIMLVCSLVKQQASVNRMTGTDIAFAEPADAGFLFTSEPLPFPKNDVTENEQDLTESEQMETGDYTENMPGANSVGKAISNKQPETFSAEPEKEADAANVTPLFVSHVENIIPALNDKEEKDVQAALKATQKIVVQLNWDVIDQSLAETVTDEEKKALKNAYTEKILSANWEKQANVLRLRYKDIDWENASKKLSQAIAGIKVDSIYEEYKTITRDLSRYKTQLPKDAPNEELAAVDGLIKQYKIAIRQIDSVRSKKAVAL